MKAFIEEFNVKSIYDPCGGWGHRLLGSGDLRYIYNDINKITYNNVIKINNHFKLNNKEFYNEDAATIDLTNIEQVDCIFTCPPYLNKEVYSDIGAENLNELEFNEWWFKTMKNSLQICKNYFIFVVSNLMSDIIKYEIPERNGLFLIREQKLGNKFNHFQRTSNSLNKGDVMFIYKKVNV